MSQSIFLLQTKTQRMSSSSSSSSINISQDASSLSADEKSTQLLLKHRAYGDAGFEKWMKNLRKQEEESFNASKQAAKKAGNDMVIMWGFLAKRRLKKKDYPQGPPDLPAPVRNLIRTFFDLETLTKVNFDGNMNVRFLDIAARKAYEDRMAVTHYYVEYLKAQATKGYAEVLISTDVIAGAPKLSGTGEALPFGIVACELQKQGLNVSPPIQPPYIVRFCKDLPQDELQTVLQDELQTVLKKCLPILKNFRAPEDVPSGGSLSDLATKVQQDDYTKMAVYVIRTFCVPRAEKGANSVSLLKKTIENEDDFPPMTNGEPISMVNLKTFIECNGGYKVIVSDNIEDGNDDDVALRIRW